VTRRPSSQNRPRHAQSSRQLPIACHGAIKFLPRVNRFTAEDQIYSCDSGCRVPHTHGSSRADMFRGAAGFVQVLDHRPIPLCSKCLKEAKLALAEIEELIVESTY
jgi:hypothetical protein